MRLIIVVKDVDGYRFINGCYGKGKFLSCSCVFNPGEYYIFVMGDWNKKVFDVTLNYQGNSEIEIERESMNKHPDIIQEIGTDLAQRFGVCEQMNKNICCYQYIDTQNGLIIENLNNECDRRVYVQKNYKLNDNLISIGA